MSTAIVTSLMPAYVAEGLEDAGLGAVRSEEAEVKVWPGDGSVYVSKYRYLGSEESVRWIQTLAQGGGCYWAITGPNS